MMTITDIIVLGISLLGIIVLIVLMVRDKNRPVGYRFTNPEDLPADDDEEDNLDEK